MFEKCYINKVALPCIKAHIQCPTSCGSPDLPHVQPVQPGGAVPGVHPVQEEGAGEPPARPQGLRAQEEPRPAHSAHVLPALPDLLQVSGNAHRWQGCRPIN